MPRPPRWKATLQAAQDEAALATKLFNDPTEPRFFEGFVVHMHLAWLYLLQARLIRDRVDYRYRQRSNPRLLERIDGEVRVWELAECVRHRWTDINDPVRKNLEFFIALRNKIEHRHSRFDEALALAVAGKAQALLLNFENEICGIFGNANSMSYILRFPVFIGSFTEEGTRTLKELTEKLPQDLNRFIAEYHSGLTEETAGSDKFELRLKVILTKSNQRTDAYSLEFVRWDDLSPEERAVVDELGKTGKVVVREQVRSVLNHGYVKLSDVVTTVSAAIPFWFTQHHAVSAWKRQHIRPPGGDPHPERTDERYCVYEALSNTYGYTEAWINKVIRKCRTAEGFENFTGCEAKRQDDISGSSTATE